ncbi:hypothetical protein ONZ51_g12925 [Trametes cubensis]|uniref:Uncharacterized protein n=1 Tax=Trametes cubensis TaxID=1111947 RepID=A0AAD7TF62_9APHY|nr:hypothetical protein ONZ51_g12925 [Trametes cubensis]
MLAASPPPPQAGPSSQNGAVETVPPSDSSGPSSPNASASSDAASKKTYLSLLPPAQIIEICLLFDPHVPLHVKSTVWPADLEAAILELRKGSHPRPSPSPQPPSTTLAPSAPNGESSIANRILTLPWDR